MAAKKMKLLESYPNFFKFMMFWWCVVVFAVMSVFILDHLFFKWRGSATISWSKTFTFDGRASREAYWAQFADPTVWSMTHPILLSADVRMVEVTAGADDDAAIADSADAKKESSETIKETVDEPTARLKPINLKPFVPGLGLILRHKAASGPREGLFFCARECTRLETPKDEPWLFQMKTIEGGTGYAFEPGTEVVDVLLHPAAEDGSVTCDMSGGGAVHSRAWRWWMGLEKLSVQGAEAMLQSINDVVGRPKKDD